MRGVGLLREARWIEGGSCMIEHWAALRNTHHVWDIYD
jgi:hypothetical protein